MPARQPYGGREVLVCPVHESVELGSAGGSHHHPDTGWCPRCQKVQRGKRKTIYRRRNG